MPDTLIGFLSGYSTVVFDLDGVIVDTNELKTDCLRTALADLDQAVVAGFVAEFRKTFGRSRRLHFSALYHAHLGRDGDFDEFYARYAGRYAERLADLYPRAALCSGARDLIAALARSGVPMTVATGTPTSEAVRVLGAHDLDTYFEAVLGGERPKHERIQEVARGATVLVGDSAQDRVAAGRAGADFVFAAGYAMDPDGVVDIGTPAGRRHVTVSDLRPETLCHALGQVR
jgi:phosphoglycolate phosphatase